MSSPATACHAPPPTQVHRSLGSIMAALFVLLAISASLALGLDPALAALIKHNPELATYSRVTAELSTLACALRSYKMNTSVLPTSEQGLQALVSMPATLPLPTNYHRIMGLIPKDPWHHEFQYRSPTEKSPHPYDLWSLGPDGISGTQDDIGNWKQPTAQ